MHKLGDLTIRYLYSWGKRRQASVAVNVPQTEDGQRKRKRRRQLFLEGPNFESEIPTSSSLFVHEYTYIYPCMVTIIGLMENVCSGPRVSSDRPLCGTTLWLLSWHHLRSLETPNQHRALWGFANPLGPYTQPQDLFPSLSLTTPHQLPCFYNFDLATLFFSEQEQHHRKKRLQGSFIFFFFFLRTVYETLTSFRIQTNQ